MAPLRYLTTQHRRSTRSGSPFTPNRSSSSAAPIVAARACTTTGRRPPRATPRGCGRDAGHRNPWSARHESHIDVLDYAPTSRAPPAAFTLDSAHADGPAAWTTCLHHSVSNRSHRTEDRCGLHDRARDAGRTGYRRDRSYHGGASAASRAHRAPAQHLRPLLTALVDISHSTTRSAAQRFSSLALPAARHLLSRPRSRTVCCTSLHIAAVLVEPLAGLHLRAPQRAAMKRACARSATSTESCDLRRGPHGFGRGAATRVPTCWLDARPHHHRQGPDNGRADGAGHTTPYPLTHHALLRERVSASSSPPAHLLGPRACAAALATLERLHRNASSPAPRLPDHTIEDGLQPLPAAGGRRAQRPRLLAGVRLQGWARAPDARRGGEHCLDERVLGLVGRHHCADPPPFMLEAGTRQIIDTCRRHRATAQPPTRIHLAHRCTDKTARIPTTMDSIVPP